LPSPRLIPPCPFSWARRTLRRVGPISGGRANLTVARDFLEPQRPRHALATNLFALAKIGDVELAVAPQGHRLDAHGDLAEQLRALFTDEKVTEAPQLAYLSEVTYPSENLYPGQFVAGFSEAWNKVIATWRSHEGKPPQMADRMHVETHVLEGRDVFLSNDRPLRVMCRRLREEHGFPVVAMGLEEFLETRHG
jgi:hypothetical protein